MHATRVTQSTYRELILGNAAIIGRPLFVLLQPVLHVLVGDGVRVLVIRLLLVAVLLVASGQRVLDGVEFFP